LLAQPILKAKQVDAKAPKLYEGKRSLLSSSLKYHRSLDDYIKTHGNSLSLKLYSQGDQITLAIASV
jgi:hypothetical protein